jgi:phosphoribosylanthranilate isomerase
LKSLKIKVCGMLHPGNIRDVAMLGPDMIGFIFYPGSSRFAGALDPGEMNFPEGSPVIKTGVFVDEELPLIMGHIARFRLDAVQLHGNESPEMCSRIRDSGIKVIKAFHIAEEKDLPGIETYREFTDWFLFDTKTSLKGGSGKKFNWSILDKYRFHHPFFLSGGIGPGDIKAIGEIEHPEFCGIDINSRFEIIPGFKDVELIGKFILEMQEMLKKQEINNLKSK